MAKQDCNVALIGTKFMGKAHSNAFLKVGRFFDLPVNPVMHTAVGRDPEATPAFAENWGWKHASTDWEKAVASDDIHVVDVTTPNNTHAPMSVAALEGGKHVACEKPLAATLDQARQMKQAADEAKKNGQHTFVWFSYRGCPAMALARKMVQEGKIGRVYHVRANYLQGWGGPDIPLVWRFTKEVAGSGAHGDLNAHIIDAARFITGEEITEVAGSIEKTFYEERPIEGESGKMGKVDVDDAVLFIGHLSGGGIASFESTRLATGNQNANRIEINGQKGSISWDFENANILWYFNAEDDGERAGWQRIMCTDGEHHPYAHAWWPDAHILGYEHGFINLASTMFNQIAGQPIESPMADFEDGYQCQRVLEAALLSARNRTPIKLEEVT